MRRLVSVVFLLLFFAQLGACASQPSDVASKEPAQKGVFWKIQKTPGLQASYLFGTIHSEDPRVTQLPPVIEQAFQASDVLALEIELDAEASKYAMANMFFSDGRDLASVVGDELYRKSVAAMNKKGVMTEQVKIMKPWAIFTMLNMPDPETGIFLDVSLYQKKLQQGKQVVGLESIQEQVATLDEMPMAAQIELLRSSLDNAEKLKAVLDDTIEIYLSRDLEQIEALNDEFLQDVSPETASIFTNRLIYIRNQRMYQRALPYLEKGNVFIAVGALHLPGNRGLINLLRQGGYTLTPLY